MLYCNKRLKVHESLFICFYVWKIMVTRRDTWGLEKSKYHFCVYKGQDGGSGKLQGSFTSTLRKVMKQISLENTCKYIKIRKVNGNSQHRLMKRRKATPPTWIPSMIRWLSWWMWGEQGILLIMTLARLFISCNILIDKLTKHWLSREWDGLKCAAAVRWLW